MTKRKFVVFAAMAVVLSSLLVVAVALAADLYLHSRAERSAGLNRWGYRGPVAGSKQPGEIRAVVLGGSTVFGYGVKWDEAIPAQLERFLNDGPGPRARVINLGFNNEGAHSFLPTLQDFDYLDFDIVCLYEGYNDLLGDRSPNRAVVRHDSVVFRLTGYFPILPMALEEKAMMLRYGDLNAAYSAGRGGASKTVFRPNIAQRSSAAALDAASAVSVALGQQLERVAEAPNTGSETNGTSDAGCAYPWTEYCDSILAATRYALSAGKQVVIVSQPLKIENEEPRHQLQQQALADMVARKLGGNPNVRYVDLRAAVDLTNTALAFDGMHLNSDGNAVIARRLVDPVLALAQAREASSR